MNLLIRIPCWSIYQHIFISQVLLIFSHWNLVIFLCQSFIIRLVACYWIRLISLVARSSCLIRIKLRKILGSFVSNLLHLIDGHFRLKFWYFIIIDRFNWQIIRIIPYYTPHNWFLRFIKLSRSFKSPISKI